MGFGTEAAIIPAAAGTLGTTAAAAAPAAAGTAAAAGGLTAANVATYLSALSTLAGLATSIYDRANTPGVGGVPKPPPFPSVAPVTPTGAALPPGERYNKPPSAPGANQPFLASLVPDQAADSNLDVLSQIRSTLG